MTDDGNAECLVQLFANRFLWCDAYGWLQYKDGYWTMTNADAALDGAVVETLRQRCAVAAAGDNFKNGGVRPPDSGVESSMKRATPLTLAPLLPFRDAAPLNSNRFLPRRLTSTCSNLLSE